MAEFSGKWEIFSSDNFVEYMIAIGEFSILHLKLLNYKYSSYGFCGEKKIFIIFCKVEWEYPDRIKDKFCFNSKFSFFSHFIK